MLDFLLRRLFRAALTLWIVVTFTFVVLRVTGDPALSLLPDERAALDKSIAAVKELVAAMNRLTGTG